MRFQFFAVFSALLDTRGTRDDKFNFVMENANDSILQQPIAAATSERIHHGWRYVMSRMSAVAVSLAVLGVVFFFIYGQIARAVWLPQYRATGQIIHDWPDATAAQFFIEEMRVNSRLAVPHSVIGPSSVIIHPRSIKVVNGTSVPVGFLGLPLLYGLLGKSVGATGVLWLTPVFAVLGVWAFYILLKRIFGRGVAWLSAVWMFSWPAYWYFSSLAFLPNVLFVDLLIIGLTLLTNRGRPSRRWWGVFLGAFLMGLALTVRPAEAPWVLAILFILLIMYPRRAWVYAVALLSGVGLAFAPILVLNQELYGHIFASGYLRISNVDRNGSLLARLPTELQVGHVSPALTLIKLIFLPFGWHPRVLLRSVDLYLIRPLWPYLALSVSGWFTWLVGKKRPRAQWAYFWCAAVSGAWLLFYYGNWRLADNDILRYNGIGSSYTRYFLPIVIFILPGAAFILARLVSRSARWGQAWRALAVIMVTGVLGGSLYYNYRAVYLAPRDGLRIGAAHLQEYYARYAAVSTMVEPDAILITDHTDKIFFPKYEVAVFLFDYSIFNYLREVVGTRPIYYFTTMSGTGINELNKNQLRPLNLKFVAPKIVDPEYRLLKLVRT